MKLYFSLLIIILSPSLAFADWLGFAVLADVLIHGDVSPDLSLSAERSWNVSLPGRGLSSPVLVGNWFS